MRIIKPHLQPLAAEPTLGQQLAADSPALNTDEDSSSLWVWGQPPPPPEDPLHAQGGGQHGCSSTDLDQVSLGSVAIARQAVEGIVKLTWLSLCRAQLTTAWAANMECAQHALLIGAFEVLSCMLLMLPSCILHVRGMHSADACSENLNPPTPPPFTVGSTTAAHAGCSLVGLQAAEALHALFLRSSHKNHALLNVISNTGSRFTSIWQLCM